MQLSSLFFIVIVISIVMFGGILAMNSAQTNNPVNQPDTFGNMPNNQTNSTSNLIVNVTNYETQQGMGMGIIFVGVITIVCVIFGGIVMMRQGKSYGRGKFRT